MSDYKDHPIRFINLGIDLKSSADAASPGSFLKLFNISDTNEGHLAARNGFTSAVTTEASAVHTIRRMDASTLLIGLANGKIYRNTTVFTTTGYSGNPLSVVPFKPRLASVPWMYVGDSTAAKMRKLKADGTDYKWGITKRSTAVAAVVNGAGNLDTTVPGAIAYDWRSTYYSDVTGAESNPTDVMSAGLSNATAFKADVDITASADAQVTKIRLYRRGGTNVTGWRLQSTNANTTATITDNTADSAIFANELLSITNDVPFTSVDSAGATALEVSMPYCFGPFLGKYIIGCGDTNRPGYVFWTNPGNPDGHDPANSLSVTSVQEPLIGGFIYNGLPYVWTRDNLHALDFGGVLAVPTFTPRRTPVGRGLSAPWAYAVGDLVYFLSSDGIYQTDCTGPAECISTAIGPIFRNESRYTLPANGDSPVDWTLLTKIRLTYIAGYLYFIFTNILGSTSIYIYEVATQRWKRALLGLANSFYADENQAQHRLYMGDTAGQVMDLTATATTDNGSSIPIIALTPFIHFDMPSTLKEIGNVIFDVDPGGNTLTLSVYKDSDLSSTIASTTSSVTGRTQIPLSISDQYVYSVSLYLTGTRPAILYGATIQWRKDEEPSVHWEFPETAHGLSGWQVLRDGYLALRTDGSLTYTVEVDGVTNSYTIASTAGARRKVYVPFNPRKGKVFRHKIDVVSASTRFRLYGDDCELRLKQWNTSLGFKLISPFTSEREI